MSDILYFEAQGKTHTLEIASHNQALGLEEGLSRCKGEGVSAQVVINGVTTRIYLNPRNWTFWRFSHDE